MNKNFGDKTHGNYAVPPEQFRAQATGVGQSQRMSRMTGAMRAQRVIDSVPPECRAAIPPAEGYPTPVAPLGDFKANY